MWEISSGRLISKFSAHRTSINNLLFTPDQKQIILSSLDQRIINLWSFNEEENSTNEIIQTFSAHNPPSFLTLNRNLNKISELHLLAVLGKKISVWNYNDSFRQNKPLSDSFSISLPQNEQADRDTFFLSAVFVDKDSILLARGSLVKPKFDKVVRGLFTFLFFIIFYLFTFLFCKFYLHFFKFFKFFNLFLLDFLLFLFYFVIKN